MLEEKTFVEQLQHGLAACKSLENLELFCGISFGILEGLRWSRPRLAVFFARTWLSSIELLSYVHPAQIRSLVIDFSTIIKAYDDLHSLPWAKMRHAIRRFEDVRYLNFRFTALGYWKRECVEYELQDFASVLVFYHVRPSSHGFRCGHANCREYAAGEVMREGRRR